MKFSDENITIGKNVTIEENVKIGNHSIIYDNVHIKKGTIICNHCVIGEPLSSYYFDQNYEQPKTVIGKDCLIRSHSIIYADTDIGDNTSTGHRVTIREKTKIGSNCLIGSYNDIQGNCNIGDYSRFHSYVNVGQFSEIGKFVFIYPFVVLTNDPTPPSDKLVGVTIDDYSQITTASIILPGARIGKSSLVGANSTVSGTFDDDSFISGSPAKKIGILSKMPFFNTEGKRHYPWPENFSRNMPWEEKGFENWREDES